MNVPNLPEALTAVKDTSVTDIIASLALGIADAQEKLDQNSIAQLETLANTEGIDGKSLLELGFLPTFYHFQYADISASIHLKIAASEEFGLDVSVGAHYSTQSGYTQEKYDFLQETHEEEHVREYESYNQFAMEAFETDSIKVNENYYNLDYTEGLFAEMDRLSEAFLATQEIDHVDSTVHTDSAQLLAATSQADNVVYQAGIGGLMTIVINPEVTDAWGVLEIGDVSQSGLITLDTGDTFNTTAGDFNASVGSAFTANGAGSVIGLYGNQIWKDNLGAQDMNIFFNTGLFNVDLATPLNGGVDLVHMQALAKILKYAPGVNVKITGYADGVGKDEANMKLSKDRAEAVRNWLNANGVNLSKMQLVYKGETEAVDNVADQDQRKVTIELVGAKGYLFFEGGDFNDLTCDAANAADSFIAKDSLVTGGSPVTAITFGTALTLATQNNQAMSVLVSEINANTSTHGYHSELVNETVYLYHRETMLKFVLMSETEQSIEIESAEGTNSSNSGAEYSYLYDQSSDASNQISSGTNTESGTSTFAIGGSVDLHYARKFSFSVEGDTSVSARLVSIPAPQVFLDYIASLYP